MSIDVRHGDCLDVLRDMPDNSVDCILTDPPYGLSNTKPAQVADVLKAWVTGDMEVVPAKRGGFMGKGWDSFVPPPAVWEECLRVLKPGGHMAVFAGARTQDLMGLSIRLAGFEIHEGMGWIYGSGFPAGGQNVSKAIDRDLAKVDTDDARAKSAVARQMRDALNASGKSRREIDEHFGTANVSQYWFSPDRNSQIVPADKWEWVRDWLGVGEELDAEVWRLNGLKGQPQFDLAFEREVTGVYEQPSAANEWAGNYMGTKKAGIKERRDIPATPEAAKWDGWNTRLKPAIEPIILARKPLGGASRSFPAFKHQAKAPKKERPVIEREDGTKIQHPTVKPVALMEWLVTLITPPNGVVLDPFAGSGSTLEAAHNKGFNSIGIEREADYIRLIEARLDHQRAS